MTKQEQTEQKKKLALSAWKLSLPTMQHKYQQANHESEYLIFATIKNLQSKKNQLIIRKARKITQLHYSLCASPEYLKLYGTPKTPDDLKDHQLLKFSSISSYQWHLCDKKGKQYVVNNPAKITTNNSNLITSMAITGHGIINTPTFVSWEAIASGKLTPILQDYTFKDVFVYAVYPNTRYVSQRVRLLIDFLVERFGDNPYWDQKQT